ncbi:uncharacterized protein N7525_007773, partial [Penicillium rubens]|uniref:uncharacterized protein n=1 Tax=Penicillium rubens TaxID=1108849 RepID=UPI002A59E6F7
QTSRRKYTQYYPKLPRLTSERTNSRNHDIQTSETSSCIKPPIPIAVIHPIHQEPRRHMAHSYRGSMNRARENDSHGDHFRFRTQNHNRPGLSTPPRHYRILPDYGTDFLWPAVEDIREDEQGYRRGRGRTRLVPVRIMRGWMSGAITGRGKLKARRTIVALSSRIELKRWRGMSLGICWLGVLFLVPVLEVLYTLLVLQITCLNGGMDWRRRGSWGIRLSFWPWGLRGYPDKANCYINQLDVSQLVCRRCLRIWGIEQRGARYRLSLDYAAGLQSTVSRSDYTRSIPPRTSTAYKTGPSEEKQVKCNFIPGKQPKPGFS